MTDDKHGDEAPDRVPDLVLLSRGQVRLARLLQIGASATVVGLALIAWWVSVIFTRGWVSGKDWRILLGIQCFAAGISMTGYALGQRYIRRVVAAGATPWYRIVVPSLVIVLSLAPIALLASRLSNTPDTELWVIGVPAVVLLLIGLAGLARGTSAVRQHRQS